jgi:N-acetyl sugar amidotransferase
MERKFQVCTQCVMDTTDVEIKFDDNGVCNHCHDYYNLFLKNPKSQEQKDKELKTYVTQIKKDGANKEYDCIAGISGGVDSTYVLHLLKQHGLRPLVVHLDNGWNSEMATKNIENAVSTLGLDLYTRVLDWREFKELQVAYLRASVLDLEALSDHAIVSTLFQMANKYGIKHIIGGTNHVTEAILPQTWNYRAKNSDAVNLKDINNKFRKKPIKDFPIQNIYRWLFNIGIKKIKWFSILDYVVYDKAEAKRLITEQLGWRDYGGKHYESVITRFYQGYILPSKFNIDKRKAHLSTLINSGQITREYALAELQKEIMPADILRQDLEYVPKKLGLSTQEFEHIMKQVPKKHSDYKTDAFIRNIIFKLYFALKK